MTGTHGFAGYMHTTTQTAIPTTIRLDSRLNGPPRSANGGIACGALAQAVGGTARVRLERPIPLGTDLEVQLAADGLSAQVSAHRRPNLAAVTRLDPFTTPPPITPSYIDALRASAASPLHGAHHMFSRCVVCGPGRPDGMHVTPGPLANRNRVLAAAFVPTEQDATDGVVHPAALWGALDCPSYPAQWLLGRRFGVLGTMAAHCSRQVRVGERLVAVGWTVAQHGRSISTASALLDHRGNLVACASTVWVELKNQWMVQLGARFVR